MISSRVGLTTMWIYPIIESIACYFMILDFVPRLHWFRIKIQSCGHKLRITCPSFKQQKEETFHKYLRIFSTIDGSAILFIESDRITLFGILLRGWQWVSVLVVPVTGWPLSPSSLSLPHHVARTFPPKPETPSFLPSEAADSVTGPPCSSEVVTSNDGRPSLWAVTVWLVQYVFCLISVRLATNTINDFKPHTTPHQHSTERRKQFWTSCYLS